MKTYLIKITLRKNILDKAGTAVSKVLIRMGYKVKNLRIGKTIYITTDEDIELKKVVKLLDIAKLSGSNRFFIATEITNENK